MKLEQIMNNFHVVKLKDVNIYFSYETPIAYEKYDRPTIVSENIWSRTTGKHVNWIKNNLKHVQVKNETFNDEINIIL